VLDWVPSQALVQGGAVGVLSMFVVGLLVGRIIPRSVLNDVRADRDARLAEERARGEQWRAAYLVEAERGRILSGHVGELLELSRTTHAIVAALALPGRGRKPEGAA
jgi:hypothetical protein